MASRILTRSNHARKKGKKKLLCVYKHFATGGAFVGDDFLFVSTIAHLAADLLLTDLLLGGVIGGATPCAHAWVIVVDRCAQVHAKEYSSEWPINVTSLHPDCSLLPRTRRLNVTAMHTWHAFRCWFVLDRSPPLNWINMCVLGSARKWIECKLETLQRYWWLW